MLNLLVNSNIHLFDEYLHTPIVEFIFESHFHPWTEGCLNEISVRKYQRG
jgi:hypothetical protein